MAKIYRVIQVVLHQLVYEIVHTITSLLASFYSVVLVSLIRVFVTEFIKQCKWFGLFSTVRNCLFPMCATDEYFYLMYYV